MQTIELIDQGHNDVPRYCLITGGAGFIGSHLAERLISENRSVVIVDDLSTGSASNLEHLPKQRHELIVDRAGDAIENLLSSRPIDQVYHLAASVGVQHVIADPWAMAINNIEQTAKVLESCCNHQVPVLIASSSEVYGKCPTLPLVEDMDLVFGPTHVARWSYGMTKALDEALALDLAKRKSLQCVVVRLFNTIGPRQVGRYGMVVPRFVQAAVNNQPLIVHGDGQQTRAFADVRDVVTALVDLMQTTESYGQVFNVGTDQAISMLDLAHRIIDLAQSRSNVELVPYGQVFGPQFEDIRERLPSIEKLRTTLGRTPDTPLDVTLALLIDSARSQASLTTSPREAQS